MPSSIPWPALTDGESSPSAPDRMATLAPARDEMGRFLTGNIGGGRKKGSRNRLTETFITAIEADFSENGSEALAKLRDEDPATYLRIVASLIPRDLILKREQAADFSDYTIEELEDLLKREQQNGQFARALQRAKGGY